VLSAIVVDVRRTNAIQAYFTTYIPSLWTFGRPSRSAGWDKRSPKNGSLDHAHLSLTVKHLTVNTACVQNLTTLALAVPEKWLGP